MPPPAYILADTEFPHYELRLEEGNPERLIDEFIDVGFL